ncbi:methylmalonyl-CoA mutase family protein [bacterium]|nr:methylmalonyl-CoA mutase family protein [bacterium]
MQKDVYDAQHHIRIVTAAALFDGHDAAINIMRRILQASGAEVIHLGHNRSVQEVVDAAVQEDAQGICVSSYQGGHVEYFTYMREMLDERGCQHIRIYGGGGGVIIPREIELLHSRGINRIFSPEDGRELGLQGMINTVLQGCDYDQTALELNPQSRSSWLPLARAITLAEMKKRVPAMAGAGLLPPLPGAGSSEPAAAPLSPGHSVPVLGITGPGGAGKSSITDELARRFLYDFPDKRVAVISVDPTRRRTGGALLGDRIRFNSIKNPRAYMRSLATRGSGDEVNESIKDVLEVVKSAGFDLVIVETAGIGQGDSAVTDFAGVALYVMTAEYGAPSQLEKIEMLDYADLVAINKFSRRGSEDALRDVRKQYMRNQIDAGASGAGKLPVFGTNAAVFNDSGVNALYAHLIRIINTKYDIGWDSRYEAGDERVTNHKQYVIPPGRERYLSEISTAVRDYHIWAREQRDIANDMDALQRSIELLGGQGNETWEAYPAGEPSATTPLQDLQKQYNELRTRLHPHCLRMLQDYDKWEQNYQSEQFCYTVRDREICVANYHETLSELQLRKVARPRYHGAGNRLFWRLVENVPGEFPFTAGTFPFRRQAEDPTRMFAGEGPSERTNRRFHYLADGQPAARLSTAFDSITLYGEEPGWRPDIYGKIGESGVSIFTVEEAEQLYSGFDLCDPKTSVSMTINGPAPTVLAFFMNTAVRQQCRRFLRGAGRLDITPEQELQPDRLRDARWEDVRALLSDEEYSRISAETLSQVRGTVQADILKEDQGQNTCIFSIEFALKMMGDVQQFFIEHSVRNFYSVSISGYHIAEAGANPIHQLAYTLANGFTYVEYYRSRGMQIDDFAPNLSFFFSNGMDPEYSVIGRVARRIWAIAMGRLYGAKARSQMLKYHIQTSGRSLHAMEIEFNDIRTTLQALLATFDNAQSLHTNAYDEAITTPTEESVRRAMAIQLIINREFGLTFCENAAQGSFIVEELTDLVEEAVLKEFDRLTERGGVLGAMERQYQRSQIQDDSLKYETLKHNGRLPIIGVNTFLPKNRGEASAAKEIELARASKEEKESCIARLERFHSEHAAQAPAALRALQETCLSGGNIFAGLMAAVQHCSLGQITHALYEVGGEYRRNV